MKVVFMGTPDFAASSLKAVVEAGHEVAAVVTQPDKAQGRSGALKMPPVKEYAVEKGITVYQPEKIRKSDMYDILCQIKPDVIIVVAFGQIIPKNILDLPKYGCINVHASLLPKYRGAAPIQWAVINGDEESGVATMQMDEGIDTGDILLVEKYKLSREETGGSLFDKLAELGAQLLVKTLDGLLAGTIIPTKQEGESSYAGKLDKNTGKIDFDMPAEEIERLVRGLNPWPSAFTYINGKSLKIWKADFEERCCKALPGTIVNIERDSFSVATTRGALKILELQLEGKKRMDTGSFLRGYNLELGMVLGE